MESTRGRQKENPRSQREGEKKLGKKKTREKKAGPDPIRSTHPPPPLSLDDPESLEREKFSSLPVSEIPSPLPPFLHPFFCPAPSLPSRAGRVSLLPSPPGRWGGLPLRLPIPPSGPPRPTPSCISLVAAEPFCGWSRWWEGEAEEVEEEVVLELLRSRSLCSDECPAAPPSPPPMLPSRSSLDEEDEEEEEEEVLAAAAINTPFPPSPAPPPPPSFPSSLPSVGVASRKVL
jgi:hypothetical protein